MAENKETGAFHKIVWGHIKPPDKVRCMLCGQMIDLESVEGDFNVVVWLYECPDCRYWLEWEIAGDGDDNIYSSSLWLIDMDDEDQESESCRGSKYYWEPKEDGYTVPDFEQVANDEAGA